MEDFGWIWALGGLLVGAGTMFGWAHYHKPQILTVASRMVEAKMSPEAIQALASGDPPTVIQVKVGDAFATPTKSGFSHPLYLANGRQFVRVAAADPAGNVTEVEIQQI